MMDVELLARLLDAAGVTLTVVDGRIQAAPASALTDELRSGIREHRSALLVLLRQPVSNAVELTDERPSFAQGDRVWLLDYTTRRPRYTEPETVVDLEQDAAGVWWAVFPTTSLTGRQHQYRWLADRLLRFEPCPACGSENRLARPDGLLECRVCRGIGEAAA
ncbi:MAG: hypothetical protein HY329_11590 [Chloroflexi bacterium]|nr:hypothetical protein [Chloroflexota bacterium]